MKANWLAGPFLVLAVSTLNVALNFAVAHAARAGLTYASTLSSLRFMAAFVIGTCSLLALVAVYVMGMAVGRAILLMGAGSIVIGTLIGVALDSTRLPFWKRLLPEEWLLLAAIAVLYAARLTRRPL